MMNFLGIKVPNNSLGVLQDVHWSMGAFDIFQHIHLEIYIRLNFLSAAKKDLGDINEQIKQGEFFPLLEWMREKIHSRGSIIEPAELIKEDPLLDNHHKLKERVLNDYKNNLNLVNLN